MRPECLDEGILQSYIDGELTGAEKEMALLHLKDCPACQQEVERIAAEDRWLLPVLRQDSVYILNSIGFRPWSVNTRADQYTAAVPILVIAATLLCYLVGSSSLAFLGNLLNSTVSWMALDQIITVIWTFVLRVVTDAAYFRELQVGMVITGVLWTVLFTVLLEWQSYYRRKMLNRGLN
jgi:hypothetical protein